MSDRQKILLSIVILVLFSLLLFIMFSDNGLADLFKLKSEKDRLLQGNIRLKRENLTMYRTIERLKNDPEYIESIARKELGMIQKGEVILKPTPPSRKPTFDWCSSPTSRPTPKAFEYESVLDRDVSSLQFVPSVSEPPSASWISALRVTWKP